jgi:hypothetical protein
MFVEMFAILFRNSAKRKTALFQDPVFQRLFVKIQRTSKVFIVKGLNTVFHEP